MILKHTWLLTCNSHTTVVSLRYWEVKYIGIIFSITLQNSSKPGTLGLAQCYYFGAFTCSQIWCTSLHTKQKCRTAHWNMKPFRPPPPRPPEYVLYDVLNFDFGFYIFEIYVYSSKLIVVHILLPNDCDIILSCISSYPNNRTTIDGQFLSRL
jgi:hypothetical protein